MAVVIIPFYVGYPIFALIALPVFLTALYGLTFRHKQKANSKKAIQKEKAVSVVAE